MSEFSWKESPQGVHTFHCETLAVTVRARADGKFSVEASHGHPSGIYDSLDEAKKYAGKFVVGMAEHALGQISMLETGRVSRVEGVVPPIWHGAGGGVAAMCGVAYVKVVEDESWYDVVSQPITPEEAETLAPVLGMPAASLVGLPHAVKQLKPGALETAKAKTLADTRKHLRGIIAQLER